MLHSLYCSPTVQAFDASLWVRTGRSESKQGEEDIDSEIEHDGLAEEDE